MLKYDARHYDDHLRLKVSLLLWLALIYGVRHFLFLAAARLMPLDIGAAPWVSLQANVYLMWSDLPALMVLLATGHRIPTALQIMRWIWTHGRWILVCSYLLGMSIFLYLHLDVISNINSRDFIAAVCVVLPDIAFMGYLLRSELVGDIFREFPEKPEQMEAKAAARPKPVSSTRQLEQEMNDAKRKELLREPVIEGNQPADFEVPSGVEPMEWMQAAAKLEARGQRAEAEMRYREVLKRSPDFAPAWHALGLLAYHAGKHELGMGLIGQAVAFDRTAGLYQRNLGEMYRRAGRLKEAISLGRVACRLGPEDAEARYNLGLALLDAGHRKEALASYREAVKINPKHALCWNNLGVILQAMGDKNGARFAYNQALSLNPANAEAQKNIQLLADREHGPA